MSYAFIFLKYIKSKKYFLFKVLTNGILYVIILSMKRNGSPFPTFSVNNQCNVCGLIIRALASPLLSVLGFLIV